MYPNNISHHKTPDAWMTHSFDMMHRYGLDAGQALDTEERYRALQQLASQSPSTGRDQMRAPRKWRQWSGELLVRAGNRLQGVTVPADSPIGAETH